LVAEISRELFAKGATRLSALGEPRDLEAVIMIRGERTDDGDKMENPSNAVESP